MGYSSLQVHAQTVLAHLVHQELRWKKVEVALAGHFLVQRRQQW